MERFAEGVDRRRTALLPVCIGDHVAEDNPVRAVDASVDALDLAALGFEGAIPEATGRPACHPATLLKIYVCGHLNRIQSSRRLEREAGRSLELMWLTGRLAPELKTVADFRRDDGPAIGAVCRQFILLCRELDLFSDAAVAVDGGKFKAVNNRGKKFTSAKLARRIEQVEAGIARHFEAMDTADRQEGERARAESGRLEEKIAALRERVQAFRGMEETVRAAPDGQGSLTDPDFVRLAEDDVYRCPAGQRLRWRFSRIKGVRVLRHFWTTACHGCGLKAQCTTGKQRRIKRLEHEGALDAMKRRLDAAPDTMRIRRQTAEHPFGTLKGWTGLRAS